MKERIKDKITQIEEYLSDLSESVPETLEEYKINQEKKAACERHFEKIVEATTDLAFLIIKQNKLKIPEDDVGAFEILFNEGIITETLAKSLQNAKRMRNVLAHLYYSIDDERVFYSVSSELGKDANEFIIQAKKLIR